MAKTFRSKPKFYHEEGCHELLCEVMRQVYRDINNDTEYKHHAKRYETIMARQSAKDFLATEEFEILCQIIGLRCVDRVRRKCLS
jgi:hypothetical protein